MATHTIHQQPYDLLLNRKPLIALRLNDRHHQQIQLGDYIHIDGHHDIMDRQRFKVVGRIDHANIHDALESIQHSSMSTRDKIQMTRTFSEHHGMAGQGHPVTEFHLEPHHGPETGRPSGAPVDRNRL
jgi:hypothetical protein